MKNCPVCKRRCRDQALACPRCKWDFTGDFLTHPSVTAPKKEEIQALEQKLRKARARWRKEHSPLRRNWFAALIRLLAAVLAVHLYTLAGVGDELSIFSVCLGAVVAATITWKKTRSPLLRFGAHELLPLGAMFWGMLLFGNGATLSGISTRYVVGFTLLMMTASAVELLYLLLNYVFVSAPKKDEQEKQSASARRADRQGETGGWGVAQVILGGLGWGVALGTAMSILFHGLPQPVLALASLPGKSSEPVVFESEAAGQAVRRSVGLEDGGELTGRTAALFETLTLDLDGGALSAADLSAFPNLTALRVSNGSGAALDALSEALPHLQSFSAQSTPVTDLSAFSGLKLHTLCLTDTSTRDLSPLAQQKDLRELLVSDCSLVTDLTPLSGLTKLERLTVRRCGVRDLTPLLELKRLEVLDLSGCPVEDRGPLETLKEKGRLKQIIDSADPAA